QILNHPVLYTARNYCEEIGICLKNFHCTNQLTPTNLFWFYPVAKLVGILDTKVFRQPDVHLPRPISWHLIVLTGPEELFQNAPRPNWSLFFCDKHRYSPHSKNLHHCQNTV